MKYVCTESHLNAQLVLETISVYSEIVFTFTSNLLNKTSGIKFNETYTLIFMVQKVFTCTAIILRTAVHNKSEHT